MANDLINSAEFKIKTTTYLLEHKHKNGQHYVSITQTTEKQESEAIVKTAHIHAGAVIELIAKLSEFSEEIPAGQLDDTYVITGPEREKIKEAYLKGVSLKDIKWRFGYSEEQITKVLESEQIAIVDQSQPEYFTPWKQHRKKGKH